MTTSVDAEQWVIGSLLNDPDVLDDILKVVSEEDFQDKANATIFRHLIATIQISGPGFSLEDLESSLSVTGELDEVGGVDYISKIFESIPHSAHAFYYAEIVRKQSSRGRRNEVS